MSAFRKSSLLGIAFILQIAIYAQPKNWVALQSSEINIKQTDSHFILKFRIDEGIHIQSHKMINQNFIPTTLHLQASAGMECGDIIFPATHAFRLLGSDESVEVFSNEMIVKVRLKSVGTEKNYRIRGSLYYQACTEMKCFFPRTLDFDLPVSIN